jgi:cobalamin biosynthesis protein CobD/CbiB
MVAKDLPAAKDVPRPVRHLRFFEAAHPTPARIKAAMSEVNGVNAKIAVVITRLVGSMWCAYVFGIIAFLGLPLALKPGGEGPIAWIAQTFLQLVLLSVIMVGQAVQSAASDARSEQTYEDTVKILDALNVQTEGGIRDLRDELLAAIAKIQSP